MKIEIKSATLLEVVNEIIERNNCQNEDVKTGMNIVLHSLQDYIKGPPFVLSEDFKKFALKEFLNNDENQLPVFTCLMELFEIKMAKSGRSSTWDVYPDDMIRDVRNMIKECFEGVNFEEVHTDFDRRAGLIDLHVQAESKKNETPLNFYAGYYHITFNNDDNEGEDCSDEIDDFHNYIKAEKHYETLFLFGCLKKMWEYINPTKVEELLNKEKE